VDPAASRVGEIPTKARRRRRRAAPESRGHSPRAADDDRASAWRDPTPRDRTQLHTPNGCAQGPTRRGGRGEGGTTPTPYRGRPRGGVPPGAPREVFVLNQYIASEEIKVSVP
jgi:hypothetical protein